MLRLQEPAPSARNRSRVEILADILELAHTGGTLKTHIMYKANLSHRQLDKYITYLTDNAMLRIVSDPVNGKVRYEVTEKGLEYLKDYSRLTNYFIGRSV